LLNDSLNQIIFTSIEYPVYDEWLNLLNTKTDSLILALTNIYGAPTKSSTNEEKPSPVAENKSPETIREAMWIIGRQKLKVKFSIEYENSKFYYLFTINRFGDYYLFSKLPAWWDGY
jgi:hypothetical protein